MGGKARQLTYALYNPLVLSFLIYESEAINYRQAKLLALCPAYCCNGKGNNCHSILTAHSFFGLKVINANII